MPPKKKKRKKRGRGQGVGRAAATPAAAAERPDPNEKRRERLEARREAKAKAMAAQRRAALRARAVRYVVITGVVLFAIWFFFLRVQLPNSIEGNDIEDFRLYSAESRANQLHTGAADSYESTPPVSGAHSLQPAPCGVLGTQIPDENMIHTLEHGGVGILYRPNLEPDEIKKMEAVVGDYESHVFSAPYAGMETPVTVVAWAHLMRLDGYDETAVREFIDVFRAGGDAPEAQQDCNNTEDEPFDPAAATPSPTASPAPSPSPSKS